MFYSHSLLLLPGAFSDLQLSNKETLIELYKSLVKILFINSGNTKSMQNYSMLFVNKIWQYSMATSQKEPEFQIYSRYLQACN